MNFVLYFLFNLFKIENNFGKFSKGTTASSIKNYKQKKKWQSGGDIVIHHYIIV